jgi:hypothetical protein
MTDARSRARTPIIVFSAIGIVVCIGLIALALHFAFFSNRQAGISTDHPSSARVVEKYLSAISSGDARTAESLDAGVRAKAPYSGSDQKTFLTDDALGAATSRIVDITSVVTLADSSRATVQSRWTLAGKHYSHLFALHWSKSPATWVLDDSLANVVQITAYSSTGQTSPGFTLGGIAAGDAASYVVYPGVYHLSVNIPASSLVDASKTPVSRELTVVPFDAVPMHRINFLQK